MADSKSRFHQIAEDAKRHVREMSVQELKARLERGDTLQIVDVREDSEWSQAHAQGAIHLGKGVIERDIEKTVPDPAAELVLYCGGGSRSALAAENLQRMGYRNVWSLAGGFRDWRSAGLPVEQGS